MKKTLQRAALILCFLAVFTGCIYGAYQVLKWKDTTGDYLSSVIQLQNTEDDLIDVVFTGSSHCYCGILPPLFWQDMGISAFDMAISGQDKDSEYYYLKELCRTQSPKVVFADLYGLLFEEHGVLGNEYRNMLSMNLGANAVNLVKDYAKPEDQMDYIARWPVIHTRYRELTQYDFREYEPLAYGRGEGAGWHAEPQSEPTWLDGITDVAPLSDKNRTWIDRMLALSEKEGFSLVFYFAPCNISEEEQRVLNGAVSYAAEQGIETINFNDLRHEVGLDYSHDFVDLAHCNVYGARKLASYLEEYMSENFELTDHRGDDAYWQWNYDLQWFLQLESREMLGQAGNDLAAFLQAVKDQPNFVAVISLEGDYVERGKDYLTALRTLGMEEDEYLPGGKWLYKKGQLTKIYENDLEADPIYLELSRYDTLRVQFLGDPPTQGNMMLGREDYSNHFYHCTVLVYDVFLNTVAAQGNF